MRLLARCVWTSLTIALGLAPCVVFLLWAEAMGRDPGYGVMYAWVMGAPLVTLPGQPVVLRAAFDVALMLAFGVLHSGLAQVPVQERLARVVGAAHVRAAYMIATGLALWGVMVAWQTLGGAAWTLVPGSGAAARAGQLGFFALLALSARFVAAGGGPLAFVGLTGGRPPGNPVLMETGAYARVRHPAYALTLVAFLCANTMTRDRLVLLAGMALYLAAGIPVEERKLVALFGDGYERYRKRVPALIPRLF